MSDGAPLFAPATASTKQYELVRWFAKHTADRMRLKLRKPVSSFVAQGKAVRRNQEKFVSTGYDHNTSTKVSDTVHTIKGSNHKRLCLREFSRARCLQLCLIVGHARRARRLIRGGVADSPEDIIQSLERIGNVAETSRLGREHVEERLARGVQEREGATAAEVDVVGESGEELLAGA